MPVARIPIYKSEWLERGRGVRQEYIQAKTAEVAKNKVKRAYGIPKSQQVTMKLIPVGRRIPTGLKYIS